MGTDYEEQVRELVVDLSKTFAMHPWQPDVHEFWHNYAQLMQA